MENKSAFFLKRLFFTLLICGFLPCTALAMDKLPHYELRVSFDVKRNLLKGLSTITLPAETVISIGNLRIVSVRLNDKLLKYEIKDGHFKSPKGTLEISYEGIFGEGDGFDLHDEDVVSRGVISEKGISLTGLWYPRIEDLAFYRLRAVLPKGFIAVSEAEEITVVGNVYSFHFSHPLPGINLAAGNYVELKESFNDIDIYGYFFPEDKGLAEKYLEYTKGYLELYEGLLGPYPYRRFSVVENFLETGYSMPTFTLLGRSVVRLPFIVETSLGHEVLHQWFGNSVYGDLEKGNWLEALTTYLADHLYEEQKGTGWEYRKKVLVDYRSYVTPAKEIALKDFAGRSDFSSRTVGYGKGAMVFHMLKELVGEDVFYASLKGLVREKKFELASWNDMMESFEKASGRDLEWFFTQWIGRKGVATFKIKDPRVIFLKGVPTVTFSVVQNSGPYRFSLPVKIVTEEGEVSERLNVEKEKEFFEIPVIGTPVEAVFDEGYDLMRGLAEEELPPVVSRLLGDEKRLVVIPEEFERYAGLVEVLKKQGFTPKGEKDIKDADIKGSSLVVLGFESPVVKRLFGTLEGPEPGFTLIVRENPIDTSKVVAVVHGDSRAEVSKAARKIFRYGKYTLLRFEKGKNIVKETGETDRGMRFSLYEPVRGIEPATTLALDGIIDRIVDKTVIYVGESHSDYEDHRVQLEVIRKLFERGRKVAIGMEMFQRPFQKVLDDYIAGTITEKEFLKASEYFKRWGMDYQLYREIIEFAKANGIPLVALNLRSEIVKKVSNSGLDSLTEEEREEIPESMDMSDEGYKKRLREVFERHENNRKKNFDNFYQAQILWDETMARSVDEFLKKNPDYQMVVIAGSGHITYGSGIAKRVYRLNGKEYATLINGAPETLDEDVADFVLFPKPLKPPFSPKLMAFLKETKGMVRVTGFPEGSISKKAGLKKGDIIVSIDAESIEALEDVKISIFDKKPGETVKVRVLRKRLFTGKKEFEFAVTM
jgi:uncharacterized iron-regulated protein